MDVESFDTWDWPEEAEIGNTIHVHPEQVLFTDQPVCPALSRA
jgi:hypothetical protein